ncbi:MAG: prepilin-type N-terminal cleavage/methylation domain-containing protein [Candidatus Saccharimonadales bacterium]
MQLRLTKDQTGLTLIEVVIAIALLAIAMAASGALATSTTRLTTESGRRTQATALAMRELETLRNHRDGLAERGGGESTLLITDLLANVPAQGSGSRCFSFVVVGDEESDTGWRLEPTSSYQEPTAYQQSDFASGGDYVGFDNFERVIELCETEEYSVDLVDGVAQGGYQTSQFLYDVEVRVLWQEAGPPRRELVYRSVLSTPLGATYE